MLLGNTPLHINRQLGWVAAGVLLIATLFRMPFPDGHARALLRVAFEVSALMAVAWFVAKQLDGFIGGILALIVFSWAYVFAVHKGPEAMTFQRVAYFSRDFCFLAAGMAVVFKWAVSGGNEKWLMRCLAAVAVVNFVSIAMQHLNIDPYRVMTLGLMKSTSTHPIGWMTNKNETSALFAFCFWAMPRRAWFVALCFAGLLLSTSMGGIASISAGLAAYGFMTGKRWRWHAGVAVCVIGLVALAESPLFEPSSPFIQASLSDPHIADNNSTAARLKIWKLGDLPISKAPLFGYGIGSWPLVTHQYHAHNEYLQLWLEVGVFAVLLVVGYFCNVLSKVNERSVVGFAAIVTIAANSAFSFPLHIAPLAAIAAVWVGMLAAKQNGGGRCVLKFSPSRWP